MKQRLTLSMCILAAASALNAQTDDQYRMEIGAGVGLMSYQGDFNGSIIEKPAADGFISIAKDMEPVHGTEVLRFVRQAGRERRRTSRRIIPN